MDNQSLILHIYIHLIYLHTTNFNTYTSYNSSFLTNKNNSVEFSIIRIRQATTYNSRFLTNKNNSVDFSINRFRQTTTYNSRFLINENNSVEFSIIRIGIQQQIYWVDGKVVSFNQRSTNSPFFDTLRHRFVYGPPTTFFKLNLNSFTVKKI